MARNAIVFIAVSSLCVLPSAAGLRVDDTPGKPGEWGFRPADGAASPTNPPGFVWRPQRGAKTYRFQCAGNKEFSDAYTADGLRYCCHCPPRTFAAGTRYWRYGYTDGKGKRSPWSRTRSFTVTGDSVRFPMPARKQLLGRIPGSHPRLFVRPEDLPRLRKLAKGDLKHICDGLVTRCAKALKNPPDATEPPKYPKGTVRKSEQWRKIWWGNRRRVQAVLGTAATLGFTRLLGGGEACGRLAKKLLLAAAQWDPRGATGYRYNDEAGMPYNYYFSRTYTFVHDLLDDDEKKACRRVMAIRGREMYDHLAPRHIWTPYGSHRNRAWHFLGEIGVAFHGEIPDAAEWTWFAMNVFYNAYPVWSDADGGWHEGVGYWRSYIARFTWWADVMRAAMAVDAYRKPYFSQVGYYPLYLQPPGTVGGGFGDLNARRRSRHNRELMAVLAAQAKNPYWQWYVAAHGKPRPDISCAGFVRGTLPAVKPKPPTDLPTARCFRGTGQAMMNTDLTDAKNNVEVIFKSSPFGTQSHGYESSNSFILYAFGERLLIRTGRRDSYGSRHHRNWMWHTKSTNCITVGGAGQGKHSRSATGRIVAFHSGPRFNYVAGEAGAAYGKTLDRFTRHVLMVKPALVVIFDRLAAPRPETCEWRLHAPVKMAVAGQENITVANGRAACRVAILAPAGLKVSQTDQFDPPPRPRVKLTEYHLTAATRTPAKTAAFVTAVRPWKKGGGPAGEDTLEKTDNGFVLRSGLAGGSAVVLLRTADAGRIAGGGLAGEADLVAAVRDEDGKTVARLAVDGASVETGEE